MSGRSAESFRQGITEDIALESENNSILKHNIIEDTEERKDPGSQEVLSNVYMCGSESALSANVNAKAHQRRIVRLFSNRMDYLREESFLTLLEREKILPPVKHQLAQVCIIKVISLYALHPVNYLCILTPFLQSNVTGIDSTCNSLVLRAFDDCPSVSEYRYLFRSGPEGEHGGGAPHFAEPNEPFLQILKRNLKRCCRCDLDGVPPTEGGDHLPGCRIQEIQPALPATGAVSLLPDHYPIERV